MSSFRFFWQTHKWTGLTLSAVLVTTSVTGFLLLIKKRVDWIQPPTLAGEPGTMADFISMGELIDIVLAQGDPEFATEDDIDRIDVRTGERLYKVRSKHANDEMQVCAITGDVLQTGTRRSDLVEQIHDGSFFADWFHDWAMPLVPVALLFMVGSGLWLWVEPKLRRRRRRAGRSRR